MWSILNLRMFAQSQIQKIGAEEMSSINRVFFKKMFTAKVNNKLGLRFLLILTFCSDFFLN